MYFANVFELTYHLDYALFASRWLRLFHALPADKLAKPLVRSNVYCGFILLFSYFVHMHVVSQISCCLCLYAIGHKTEHVHITVLHLVFVS